jgi:hypothetical protein
MPRILPGSLIIELDLDNIGGVLDLLRRLVQGGVNKTGLLLEPTTLEVEFKYDGGSEIFSISLTPPSLIIQGELGEIAGKVFKVVRDAWANFAMVDLSIVLRVFSSFIEGKMFHNDKLEIVLIDPPKQCSEVLVLETFAMLYPRLPHMYVVNYTVLNETLKHRRADRKIDLLICILKDGFDAIAWIEPYSGKRRLYIVRSLPGFERLLYSCLLDVVTYVYRDM